MRTGNLRFTYANKSDLTTTAFTATAQNRDRRYICLHNTHGSNIIYARFGDTATSGTGHVVKAGEKLEFGALGGHCPIDYLSVYGSAASTTYSLVEGF